MSLLLVMKRKKMAPHKRVLLKVKMLDNFNFDVIICNIVTHKKTCDAVAATPAFNLICVQGYAWNKNSIFCKINSYEKKCQQMQPVEIFWNWGMCNRLCFEGLTPPYVCSTFLLNTVDFDSIFISLVWPY